MYHARMTTHIASYDLEQAVAHHILSAVGSYTRSAAAHFSLGPGGEQVVTAAQVFEMHVTSPLVATDLAEEVCRIAGLEYVHLFLDGRSIFCRPDTYGQETGGYAPYAPLTMKQPASNYHSFD